MAVAIATFAWLSLTTSGAETPPRITKAIDYTSALQVLGLRYEDLTVSPRFIPVTRDRPTVHANLVKASDRGHRPAGPGDEN